MTTLGILLLIFAAHWVVMEIVDTCKNDVRAVYRDAKYKSSPLEEWFETIDGKWTRVDYVRDYTPGRPKKTERK